MSNTNPPPVSQYICYRHALVLHESRQEDWKRSETKQSTADTATDMPINRTRHTTTFRHSLFVPRSYPRMKRNTKSVGDLLPKKGGIVRCAPQETVLIASITYDCSDARGKRHFVEQSICLM